MAVTTRSKRELADPTAQPSSKRSKTSGSHPKQKQAQSVDFREVFIQKLTTPEVSHLFEASADPRIAECNVFSKTKYRIRAGTLVTCMPIVGGKVGHSIDLNAMAIVTEVDAGKGRVVLCNRMELYDDNHVGENALEALGCNRKVMLYALDKDGVLQHASNKEFVEFDRLYLETSKLKDGTYKSVDAIINHIFAKRKFDANMFASEFHKRSEKKKLITDPHLDMYCELIGRLMNKGYDLPALALRKGELALFIDYHLCTLDI